MPNVVIEHSSNVTETKPLMDLCHNTLMESGLFQENSIKVRTISISRYLVGGKSGKTFIATTVSVMPGRAQEDLSKLGGQLQERMQSTAQELGLTSAISVLVEEYPEGLYFRKNLD